MAWVLDPSALPPESIDALAGVYYTGSGIKEVLGKSNTEVASQLDNDVTTPDLARIAADGAHADAYTNWRARQGSNRYVTPIPSSSVDFPLVRMATNLYAAYWLVRHRVWTSTDAAAQQQMMVDLKGEAMDLYEQLFGPARDGIDGSVEPNPTPEPGTFTSVPMTFDPAACAADEFAG